MDVTPYKGMDGYKVNEGEGAGISHRDCRLVAMLREALDEFRLIEPS